MGMTSVRMPDDLLEKLEATAARLRRSKRMDHQRRGARVPGARNGTENVYWQHKRR